MEKSPRFYRVMFLFLIFSAIFRTDDLWASDWLILTPGMAMSDGRTGFGGQAKLFFVPNLGIETDLLWTPQICSDCTLSQTTLTENLFYWINPFGFLSLYIAGGGGIGMFGLSSPQSESALLPVFDFGLGGVIWPGKHIGIEIDNRWFFPAGGGIDGNPSSRLDTDRWFAGIAIPF
ncbi:MAG: hypothetical protein ACYCRD_03120 [Leptospirillum sp.]